MLILIPGSPPDPPIQGRRFVPQAVTAVADRPIRQRPWLSGTIAQWTQEQFQTQVRRYLVQEAAAAAADNPPFGLQPWLPTILKAWESAEPQPKQAVRQMTEEGAVAAVAVVKTGTGGIDPVAARKRGIIKPLGTLHLPIQEGRKEVADRVDEARAIQAEIAARLHREFTEETIRTGTQPISAMRLPEIEAEIGYLLRKKLRTDEDEILLLLLMVAAGQ